MVRFYYKEKEAVNAKILKDVKFPMMLDMFDLCSPDLQERLKPMRAKFKEEDDRLLEEKLKPDTPKAEVHPLAYSFEDDVGSNNSGYYELQAVLTHRGRSSNSGHYVAWVKYKGDTWIECNDDDVNPIH